MTSLTRPFYLMPLMLTEESEKQKKNKKKIYKNKKQIRIYNESCKQVTHSQQYKLTHTYTHTPYTDLRTRKILYCETGTHTHTHTLANCCVFPALQPP